MLWSIFYALPMLMCCVWNLHCIATETFTALFCTYLFTLTQNNKIVPVFFRGGLSWSDADTVSEVNTFNGHNNQPFYTLLLFHSLAETLIAASAALLVRSEKAHRRSHCIAVAKSQGLLKTSFGRMLKHSPDTMRNLKYSHTDGYLPDARACCKLSL